MATLQGVVAWRGFLCHGNVASIRRLEKRVAGIYMVLFAALILEPEPPRCAPLGQDG